MSTTIDTTELAAQQCAPRHSALTEAAAAALLAQLPGWSIRDGKLCQSFGFRNYYQTLAFVNALAYMTHAQDHHPELTVGYQECAVRYDTHSAGGLSENDFICAAKADAIYRSGSAGAAVAA